MTFDEAKRFVLDSARAQGIQVEVLGQRRRELTVRARQGAVEQITQAVQGGIGLRVVVDGRVGYGYTEELSPPALAWALGEAVDNAALQSGQDGFLPEGRGLGHHDLVGESLTASFEAKVQAALGFEATLREDARVKQVMFGAYGEREADVTLASTQGTEGSYRRGLAGMGGSVVMQEGNSVKQGWDFDWFTSVQMLDPGRTALKLTERTGRLLGARPLVTGRYTAYLEPKAFAALLAAFWPLWSGKAVMEGKSLLAGRLGETIASSMVTLVDDPLLTAGLGNRPFDSEGTPARPAVLVENGVLKGYLTNSQTARALDVPNTGHAFRPYRGNLNVMPTNLHLKPGSGVTPGNGVIVAEVMGVHAGASAVTGDFSVQGLGLMVEGGELVYPVENFAFAGNFLTLLRQIAGVGDTLEWDLGMMGIAVGVPMVEIQDLSFAGT